MIQTSVPWVICLNFDGWVMRAEAEQLIEFDQAVRGTAEEASLTSTLLGVVSANSMRNLKIQACGPIPTSPKR